MNTIINMDASVMMTSDISLAIDDETKLVDEPTSTRMLADEAADICEDTAEYSSRSEHAKLVQPEPYDPQKIAQRFSEYWGLIATAESYTSAEQATAASKSELDRIRKTYFGSFGPFQKKTTSTKSSSVGTARTKSKDSKARNNAEGTGDGSSSINEEDSSSSSSGFNCSICLLDRPPESFRQLTQCNHSLCSECIQNLINVSLRGGYSFDGIRCPFSESCPELHPSDLLPFVENDPRLFQRWQNSQMKRALMMDPCARWCPGQDCEYVVIGAPECPKINCASAECGVEFCYFCQGVWHDGKCPRRENVAKALSEVKCCPRCNSLIKKDGGCYFIVCTVCGEEFCWGCRQAAKESEGGVLHLVTYRSRCVNSFRQRSFVGRFGLMLAAWASLLTMAPTFSLLLALLFLLFFPLLVIRRGHRTLGLALAVLYPVSVVLAACLVFWLLLLSFAYITLLFTALPFVLFATNDVAIYAVLLAKKPADTIRDIFNYA